MKKFTQRILGNIVALIVGGFAGFGLARSYIDSNPFFLILIIPCIIFVTKNFYAIRVSMRKIKKIEKDFKDEYGFGIRDKKALEKYLEEIGKNKK